MTFKVHIFHKMVYTFKYILQYITYFLSNKLHTYTTVILNLN